MADKGINSLKFLTTIICFFPKFEQLKITIMKNLILLIALAQMTMISVSQSWIDGVERMPVNTPDPSGIPGTEMIIGQKLTESLAGKTWYDLQTYGALSQRMYAYPDGTMAATWIIGFDPATWIDRGTGYNYFDGFQWGEFPTQRLESIRTGWGCYAPLGPNGEIVVAHAQPSTDWVLHFSKRENKGTGAWEEFDLAGPVAGTGIVWPTMITNGPDHNIIHVLTRTYTTPYMGQDGALLYYRSSDAGLTWDIQAQFFTELGPDYFVAIDADGYDWAQPVGNTIAFSVGFDSGHACIMKSTDNGESWEFIQVYHCPFYPSPGGLTPSFGAGDGTQAAAIDNSGNVHVVFGRMVYVYDETGALFYYPATDGLIYWNETMPELDSTLISSYTTEFLLQNGNLAGWVVDPGISGLMEFPSYFTSLTSHPQILIDEFNRIFTLWMGAAPTFNNGTWNYRHIYGNSSSDGGLTWNGIKDFNLDLVYIFSECIYPALSPVLYDNKFHFWFENDVEPGIFVWAAQQAEASENNITCMSIETGFLTGIEDNHSIREQLTVSANYPNPFKRSTFIDVTLGSPSEIRFRVCDLAGRIIHSESFGMVTNDRIRIAFENIDIPEGIYFYTVSSEEESFTGKMVKR